MKTNLKGKLIGTLILAVAAASSVYLFFFILDKIYKYNVLAYTLCVALLMAIDVGATAFTVNFCGFDFNTAPKFIAAIHALLAVFYILSDALASLLLSGLISLFTLGLVPTDDITSPLNFFGNILLLGIPLFGSYCLSAFVGDALWTKKHPEEVPAEAGKEDAEGEKK